VLILGPSSWDCMDGEMHCLFAEKMRFELKKVLEETLVHWETCYPRHLGKACSQQQFSRQTAL